MERITAAKTHVGSHKAISSIVDPFGWNVRLYIRKWVG